VIKGDFPKKIAVFGESLIRWWTVVKEDLRRIQGGGGWRRSDVLFHRGRNKRWCQSSCWRKFSSQVSLGAMSFRRCISYSLQSEARDETSHRQLLYVLESLLQLPRCEPDELCLSYIPDSLHMDVRLGGEGKHDQHVVPHVSSQIGRFVHLENFFCRVSTGPRSREKDAFLF